MAEEQSKQGFFGVNLIFHNMVFRIIKDLKKIKISYFKNSITTFFYLQ